MFERIKSAYVEPHNTIKVEPQKVIVSIIFGLVFAVLNYFAFSLAPYDLDFQWSIHMARDFVAGVDPYDIDASNQIVPYPLPVILVGLPLLPFSPAVASGIFVGFAVFLIVLGLFMKDEFWRYPLLFSAPFIGATMIRAQWGPILIAAWMFPIIAPYFVLVKPQNALPVALAKWHWKGVIISAVILAITLIIDPTWPIRWLSKSVDFEYFIPVFVLPLGPLILVSIRYWKQAEGRLLFLMSLMPTRAVYDLTLLWVIPKNRYQVWALTLLSWVYPIVSFQGAFAVRPGWTIPFLFLPALACLIWENDKDILPNWVLHRLNKTPAE